jgi:hypothetical protein
MSRARRLFEQEVPTVSDSMRWVGLDAARVRARLVPDVKDACDEPRQQAQLLATGAGPAIRLR